MEWWGYVLRVTGLAQQKDIAVRAGVDQSTVSRWKTTGRPGDPANVARLARAYGRPVLEAFIEAGFLTQEEARAQIVRADLALLKDEDLLTEIARRLGVDVALTDGAGRTVVMQMKRGSGESASYLTGYGSQAVSDGFTGPSGTSVADEVDASSRVVFAEESVDDARS